MMHLLKLNNIPILQQLQIEEALLRADEREWCLINSGSSEAIVMGISGKPEKLLHADRVRENQIPVIKRFSGGGTVFIDADTVFVTFIRNTTTSGILAQPRAIYEWTETLYRPLFPASFAVKENDYVLGEKKCGGNAHYLQKSRWLHHTSFLWKFEPAKMNYLKLPEKRPQYRNDRSHEEFLCTLQPHFEDKEAFLQSLVCILQTHFTLREIELDEIDWVQRKPHRKATERIAF